KRSKASPGPTRPAVRSRSRSGSLPIGAAIAPMPDDWRPRAFRAATRLANCGRTRTARAGHKALRSSLFGGLDPAGPPRGSTEPTHSPIVAECERWESQMDKIVKLNHRLKKRGSRQTSVVRPSREEAEDAVRTLIRWAGDDPDREGLVGTPARVARAY